MKSSYQKRPTQEQRILDSLREKGEEGLYVYEIMTPRPNGLGIAQYTARIWGLRQKGYVIVNPIRGGKKITGLFVLTHDPDFTPSGQGVLLDA